MPNHGPYEVGTGASFYPLPYYPVGAPVPCEPDLDGRVRRLEAELFNQRNRETFSVNGQPFSPHWLLQKYDCKTFDELDTLISDLKQKLEGF